MKKPALQKPDAHYLAKQAREFLMDIANVPDWWVGQPPGAFTERSQFDLHRRWAEQMRKRYPEAFRYCTSPEIIALRELLRKVWTAPEIRSKEWFICLFRRFHSEILRRVEALQKDAGKSVAREWRAKKAHLDIILMEPVKPERVAAALLSLSSEEQVTAAFKDGPPHPGYFENCAAYLQRRLKLLRICRPDCKERRYFIADKPKQKYCSDICARESRLASKRDWWQENRGKDSKKRGK
jgi:hypothetical protein